MKLIKDSIWVNIIYSNLEFKVFSLPIFNRLHYILENSMAYLVYPSNKTSRLLHNGGVCHIAGEIYKAGIRNAPNDIIRAYLEDKKKFLNDKIKDIERRVREHFGREDERYIQRIFNKLDSENSEFFANLYNYEKKILGEYFIKSWELVDVNKDLLFVNAILLQSVRFFGLFHDYGHLPFSHLFEFAIKEFHKEIDGNEDYRSAFEKLTKLLEKKDEIHEAIGKNFSILTLQYIKENMVKNFENEEKIGIFVIFEFLIKILKELFLRKDPHLYSLYEIISSDLDADRLDYVVRDLQASGLGHNIDVDRIIKFFTLGKRENIDESENKDNFKFYPAIQSIYDIEMLFENRQNLYKMVINHHKVKKFDYILQNLIKILFYEELKNKENEESKNYIAVDTMSDLINLIHDLLKYEDEEGYSEYKEGYTDRVFYRFSQVTDYWILSKLRTKLINIIIDGAKTKEDERFEKLANELFGGTKKYKSLYKREYEFEDFIKELSEKLKLSKEELLKKLEEDEEDKDFNWKKEVEKDPDILIASIKLPKAPENLKLIDIKTNEIFPYKQRISDYRTKFFIYVHNKSREEVIKTIADSIEKINK